MIASMLKARRSLAVGMLLSVALLTTGCGKSPDQLLWEQALEIYQPHKEIMRATGVDPWYVRTMHENTAGALETALRRFPEAERGLQQVLQDIRDGEYQLAQGRLREREAEAVRQRNAEFWSHLERRELPPGYL